MVTATGLCISLPPRHGKACFTTPEELERPHAEVVKAAKQIFWAEVISTKPSKIGEDARKPVTYSLRVVRVLKGDVRPVVEIQGDGDLSGIWDTTFANHEQDEFWKGASGRMGIKGDCTMVPPLFVQGKRYLVLLGMPEDTKQYERVDVSNDRWFTFVEKQAGHK
jgi:hypothetical protein